GSSDRAHAKGQPATTSISGNRRESARTAVDFAVPLWPRIRTPPIIGLMAFSSNASLIDSCPTMAVNGNTARVRMMVLRDVKWYSQRDCNIGEAIPHLHVHLSGRSCYYCPLGRQVHTQLAEALYCRKRPVWGSRRGARWLRNWRRSN